ncbi:MAG: rod shape-determining protein RodA [Candidatus Kerfeldbacteria bacterium]|nr:rod shape-determining protein RodA [Candidatus Kerfeldbacteria bacterium]
MIVQSFVSRLKQLDGVLFALTLILVCFGIAALYSVTSHTETGAFLRLNKQLAFAAVGFAGLLAMSFLDYRVLRGWRNPLFLLGVLSLVGVLVIGTVIRETQRWYTIAGITIQPSEFAKLALLIFLAGYLAHAAPIRTFRPIVVSGIATSICVLLLFLQPDVGTAILFFTLWLVMLIVARTERRLLAVLGAVLVVLALAAWFFVLHEYQQDRIRTFFDPNRDPLNVGYNVTQSIIAVGSGRLFGRGLGLGPQSQLNFLPEQETDFIFAVIAEELGFVGVVLILAVYGLLLMRMLRTARRARDAFSFYFVTGLTAGFAIQISINVGMNIGLLPVTGIPLPFISAGGSSLVTNLLALGIIQSISRSSRQVFFRS